MNKLTAGVAIGALSACGAVGAMGAMRAGIIAAGPAAAQADGRRNRAATVDCAACQWRIR